MESGGKFLGRPGPAARRIPGTTAPVDTRDDIALLVEHFRREVNQRPDLGLDITGVSRDAMAILEHDDWPGNVCELEAVVTRAMVRRSRGWVTPEGHRAAEPPPGPNPREGTDPRGPSDLGARAGAPPGRSAWRGAPVRPGGAVRDLTGGRAPGAPRSGARGRRPRRGEGARRAIRAGPCGWRHWRAGAGLSRCIAVRARSTEAWDVSRPCIVRETPSTPCCIRSSPRTWRPS